jgi:galactose mutarotase-like enzyme
MKENNFEQKDILKIETIDGPNNGEASVCGERGFITTSVKQNGKEILYQDKESFENVSQNVKGGIPVLFPNAGPLKEGNLKQHGFARNLNWQVEKKENEIKGVLVANKETMEVFPHDFKMSIILKFEEDGSLTVTQEVENKGDKEMPISDGFHPYINAKDKKDIKFNFEGGKYIEEHIEEWANGHAVSIDNPKLNNPEAVLEVYIPELGTLVIDPSIEYQKIWVWSLPGKDFVCVEPVMRDANGLIDNPEIIKPKETFKARINYKLKES